MYPDGTQNPIPNGNLQQPQLPSQSMPLPPVPGPRGEVNPFIITTLVLTLLTLGLSGFGIWSYINYSDQKNNVDDKVEVAVAEAKRSQTLEDERKFAEREKAPYVAFVGPEDLGRVTFNYPKTWSAYVSKDTRSGTELFQATFHPGVILPLQSDTFFALKMSILDKSYDKVLESYQSTVKKGSLKSTPISVEGENGTRLDGNFSKTMQGSAVFFKIRDKTLQLQTESRAFQSDFDKIIVESLSFNK